MGKSIGKLSLCVKPDLFHYIMRIKCNFLKTPVALNYAYAQWATFVSDIVNFRRLGINKNNKNYGGRAQNGKRWSEYAKITFEPKNSRVYDEK